MVVKQIAVALCLLLCGHAFAQKTLPETEDLTGFSIIAQTSSLFFVNSEQGNYTKFGFGAGAEYIFYQKGKMLLSCAPLIGYSGAHEEQNTFSTKQGVFFYRSTLLTGKLTLQTPLYVQTQLKNKMRIGVGFQPQFLAKTFKKQTVHGTSSTDIPDIHFLQTESSLMVRLGFQIDPLYRVQVMGQFGLSPVTLNENSPVVHGVRFQISRELKFPGPQAL